MNKLTSKQKQKLKGYSHWSDIIKDDFKRNPEEAYAYLTAALKNYEKDGNEKLLLLALRRMAEAVGVANLAKKAGLSRQSIYKALSEHGNPTLKTLDTLLHALGFTHSFKPI
ncbi:putative addiction module antidote protein [bacterium]|nr:putative addiction module antidote protein [bacterium]